MCWVNTCSAYTLYNKTHSFTSNISFMRIAFDAKRAYQNTTGLGQYSRTLISSLAKYYPAHEYFLMAPRITDLYALPSANVKSVAPEGWQKKAPSLWRSYGVKNDLKKLKIDLYHGLSHEVPVGLQHTCIKSVVTIHDLIFERYPKQYKKLDVTIYRKKFRYACQYADKIIAISTQTRNDIIDLYHIPPSKVEVCYQSCNPVFEEQLSQHTLQHIKSKYNLPEQYYLYVGSVIERKNLLTICKALRLLDNNIPLVVVGMGGEYMHKVKAYLTQQNMLQRVIFLSENKPGINTQEFYAPEDMPGIYQLSSALIYPSVYEGFGIPILEALWSSIPVITSGLSCMPETGGDAALYIDPVNEHAIADAMNRVVTDTVLRSQMIHKGLQQAARFSPEKCAAQVMNVYTSLT
jgi:glycosyltransferase involved in cell wall biosynthesis